MLASSLSADFVFFPGDANNDGTVNLLDFNRLAANFGQSPRTFSQGDFNYDGVVNLLDFNVLASRFGTAIGTSNNLARIGAAGAPWAGNSDTRGGRGSPWEDNDDDSDELAQRSDER